MSTQLFFENSRYAEAFLRYLVDHLDDAERIPDGACIVFRHDWNDSYLWRGNLFLVDRAEAHRGRTILPVIVRETLGPSEGYEFVLPWTLHGRWVVLYRTPWIQEPTTSVIGTQASEQTQNLMSPQIFADPFRHSQLLPIQRRA
jgi:hypothetical protein